VADRYLVQDISKRTIPEDFRDQRIHQAFFVRHRGPGDGASRKD
jgi:hypothetical protein